MMRQWFTAIFDWIIEIPGDRCEGGYTSQVALEDGE